MRPGPSPSPSPNPSPNAGGRSRLPTHTPQLDAARAQLGLLVGDDAVEEREQPLDLVRRPPQQVLDRHRVHRQRAHVLEAEHAVDQPAYRLDAGPVALATRPPLREGKAQGRASAEPCPVGPLVYGSIPLPRTSRCAQRELPSMITARCSGSRRGGATCGSSGCAHLHAETRAPTRAAGGSGPTRWRAALKTSHISVREEGARGGAFSGRARVGIC